MEAALAAYIWILSWGVVIVAAAGGAYFFFVVTPRSPRKTSSSPQALENAAALQAHSADEQEQLERSARKLQESLALIESSEENEKAPDAPPPRRHAEAALQAAHEPDTPIPPGMQAMQDNVESEIGPPSFFLRIWNNKARKNESDPVFSPLPELPAPSGETMGGLVSALVERRSFMRIVPHRSQIKACHAWLISERFSSASLPRVDKFTPFSGCVAEIQNISAGGVRIRLSSPSSSLPANGRGLLIHLVLKGVSGSPDISLWCVSKTLRASQGEGSDIQASARFLCWKSHVETEDGPVWCSVDEKKGVPMLHAWVRQTHVQEKSRPSEASVFSEAEKRDLRDPMTGVGNEAFFFKRIGAEWKHSQSSGFPLSCIAIELCRSQKILDEHGCEVMQQVLKTMTLLICENIRVRDSVACLDKRRFYVMLPETGLAEGRVVAQQLRDALEEILVPLTTGKTLHLNVAVGLAATDFGESTAHTVALFLTSVERDLQKNRSLALGSRRA